MKNHMKQMRQSVLDLVSPETPVEVEEIFRRLPFLRWQDVFNCLHHLRLDGKIVLEQYEGDSTVLVMKIQMKGNPSKFQLVGLSSFTRGMSYR